MDAEARREEVANQAEDRRRVHSLRRYLEGYPDVGGRYAAEIVHLEGSIARRSESGIA